jgi:drug/metabolite transporter (DMT)-like permease
MSPAAQSILIPLTFVLIWATGFVVARLVAPFTEPLSFLALRFGLAALVLGLAGWWAGARWPPGAKGWRDAGVAGILLHGGYLGGVFWAVKNGLPAGIAALIAGMQPLVTAALSAPLLGEHVSGRGWTGIVIGFTGVALVIGPGAAVAADTLPPVALLVCAAGVLSITVGTIWQKRTGAAADLRTGTSVQYLGAGVATLLAALLVEDMSMTPSIQLAFGMVWAIFVLSIGGVGLLLLMIRRGAVSKVATLLFLVPPVSALLGYLLFGETLTLVQIAGMALACAGVAVTASERG